MVLLPNLQRLSILLQINYFRSWLDFLFLFLYICFYIISDAI
nr:MAG TPA: hypothetical protein [Caudoviricetes sp.]